jgi:hypothetical protein
VILTCKDNNIFLEIEQKIDFFEAFFVIKEVREKSMFCF